MKIFVINPGSTSTKVALFEDDKELVRRRYESLGSQAVALVPVR